jgi:hypothetical protein
MLLAAIEPENLGGYHYLGAEFLCLHIGTSHGRAAGSAGREAQIILYTRAGAWRDRCSALIIINGLRRDSPSFAYGTLRRRRSDPNCTFVAEEEVVAWWQRCQEFSLGLGNTV